MSLLFIEPLVVVDVSTSTFLEGTRTSYVDYELYIPLDLNACFNDVTNSLKFQLPITDLDSEADFDKAQAWTPVSDGVLRLDGISTSGFDAQLEYADFKVQGSSNYTSLNPYMYSVNGLRPVITGDSVEDWYRNRCIVKSGIGTDRKLQSSDDFSVADATPRSTFEDILNHLFLGTTTTPSGVQVKPPVSPETRDAIQKWLVHEGIGVNSQRLANAIFDTRQSQDLMRKVLLLGKYQRNPGGFGTVELADKDIVSIPVDLRESSGNVISIRLNFVQTEHAAIPKHTGSSPTASGELNNEGEAEEAVEDDPLSLSGIRTLMSPAEELFKLSGAPVDTDTFIIQGSYAEVQRLMTGENVTQPTIFRVWHFADSNTWESGLVFPVQTDGTVEIGVPEEGKEDAKFTVAVREALVQFANYQCIPEFSVASITENMSPDYGVYKTRYGEPPLYIATTFIVLVANDMMLEAQAGGSTYVSTSPVFVFEQTSGAWALIRSYKSIDGVLTVDTGSVSWGDDVYTGLTGGSVSNLAEFDTIMMALNSLFPHPPPQAALDAAATQPAAPAAVTAYVPTPSTSVGVPNELTITFDDSVSINRTGGGKVNIYQRINGFTSSIIIDASDTTQLTLGTTNNTVKITPTTPMLNNSWNYILIDNTVIEDTSGNPFTSLVSDHTVWSFNIGTPIMSPSLEPVVGVTDIATGFSPVITFQENIELVNGKNVEIRIHSDDTVVFAETISGSQLTVGVVDGNSMQINPPNDLPGGVKYYVYIEPGTIKNLSGHPFNDAFGKNWYFTTVDEQAAAAQAAAEQAAAAQAAIDAVNAAALVAANTTIMPIIDLHNQAYAMYSNSATITPTTLIIAATKNMVTQANTGTGSISDPNGVVVYQYISESWQIRQMFEVVNNSLVSLRSESMGGSGLMWGGVNHTMDPKYNYNGVEVISAGAVLSNLVLKYSRY